MKNLKKLFVVLPLVLVMLLSVVPVMAEKWVADGKLTNAQFQVALDNTAFGKADEAYYLNTKGTEMPIWVGEVKPFAAEADVTVGGRRIVLLNGGAVHGWVKTNYHAVSPLAVAQNYVATQMPEYNIPTYQILNVLTVKKQVMVPENWLAEKDQPTKQVIDPDTAKIAYVNAKFTAEVNNSAQEVVYAANSAVPADKIPADVKWVHDADDKTATAVIKIQVPTKVGENGTEEVEVKIIADVAYIGKTETVPAGDKTKLVPAYVEGLLIIVEESNMAVEVTHHFVFADGTEIVQTSEQKWAKANGALTVATVNPNWYMAVPGFTIDTTKTAVSEVRDNGNYYVLGEKVLLSYKVDLYYTAGEGADKGQVDAAIAGNTANVANAQQLPATGAADSFALVLSSLALVVVGLFFKK